jgi:hypothetical protein
VSCPDGWSTGNLYLVAGMRIGTTVHGTPILAPGDPTLLAPEVSEKGD